MPGRRRQGSGLTQTGQMRHVAHECSPHQRLRMENGLKDIHELKLVQEFHYIQLLTQRWCLGREARISKLTFIFGRVGQHTVTEF